MAIKILNIYDLTNKLLVCSMFTYFCLAVSISGILFLNEYLNTLNMFMCYCDVKFVPARHQELLIKKHIF